MVGSVAGFLSLLWLMMQFQGHDPSWRWMQSVHLSSVGLFGNVSTAVPPSAVFRVLIVPEDLSLEGVFPPCIHSQALLLDDICTNPNLSAFFLSGC